MYGIILCYHCAIIFITNISNIRFKSVKVASTANISKQIPEANQNRNIRALQSQLSGGLVLGLDVKDDREQKQEYEESICMICFSENVNALYKPCNHGGMCKECSILNFNQTKKCALCRKIVEFIVIYEEREDGNLYQVDQFPNEVIIE